MHSLPRMCLAPLACLCLCPPPGVPEVCLSTLRQALSRTWKEACNAYLDVCPEKRLADYDPRTGRWISLGCSSQATFFPKNAREEKGHEGQRLGQPCRLSFSNRFWHQYPGHSAIQTQLVKSAGRAGFPKRTGVARPDSSSSTFWSFLHSLFGCGRCVGVRAAVGAAALGVGAAVVASLFCVRCGSGSLGIAPPPPGWPGSRAATTWRRGPRRWWPSWRRSAAPRCC